MRAPPQSRPSRGRTVDRRHQKDQRRMKAMLLRGPNLPFEPVELPDPAPAPDRAVPPARTEGSGLATTLLSCGVDPFGAGDRRCGRARDAIAAALASILHSEGG